MVVEIHYCKIKSSLKKGKRVELRGFGTWSIRIQKKRISRSAKTGEKFQIPEKKTIFGIKSWKKIRLRPKSLNKKQCIFYG